MIDLHFTPTPNGQKVSIALEEMELPYQLINYDIFEGDQHTAEFGKINPNHKLPAIVDHDPSFGGGAHAVFESGAILQYLAEKTGRFLPHDPRQRSVALQWLTWQVASLGPMGGQAAHFMRYAPEKIDYAIERYSQEAARLTRILERRLDEAEYLAGDAYSIADMISYPWAVNWQAQGQDIEEFPYFKRWLNELAARPAVQRGMAVGAELADDPATLSEEERERRSKLLYNQRARPAPVGGLL